MIEEQLFLLRSLGKVLNEEYCITSANTQNINREKLLSLIKRYGLSYFAVTMIPEINELSDIEKNNVNVSGQLKQLQIAAMSSVAKSMRFAHAWQKISNSFEETGIDYLPLKGITIKDRYPVPELRTMCDIDILYREEQHKAMLNVMNKLGFETHMEGIKHDHFVNEQGQHIEMHREMVEAGTYYREYYKDIWKRVKKAEGYQHQYCLNTEDEYIFTIVHLKEHFIHNEAVLRMIMDVYVLNRKSSFDWKYINIELEKIGLLEFEENIRKLAYCWFSSDEIKIEEDNKLYDLSEYFLGNSYPNTLMGQKASWAYQMKGKKWNYFVYAVFPSLHRMESLYPWLRNKSVLYPAAWFLRLWRAVKYRKGNVAREVFILASIDRNSLAQGKQMVKVFEKYGIRR